MIRPSSTKEKPTSMMRGISCPSLSAAPMVRVGPHSVTLEMPLAQFNEQSFPGFSRTEEGPRVTLEKEWKHTDPTLSYMSGGCFWHSVSIEAEEDGPRLVSITVQNWAEPGC